MLGYDWTQNNDLIRIGKVIRIGKEVMCDYDWIQNNELIRIGKEAISSYDWTQNNELIRICDPDLP